MAVAETTGDSGMVTAAAGDEEEAAADPVLATLAVLSNTAA